MRIQSINNQPDFRGQIIVSGLSKQQRQVFDGIKDMLFKKVTDKDFLILHINGSLSPHYESRDSRFPSKYVIMHTQVKSATVPTARAYTDSLNPNEWLKKTDNVIKAHLESDLYQKAIDGELDSFWGNIKKLFEKLIGKNK